MKLLTCSSSRKSCDPWFHYWALCRYTSFGPYINELHTSYRRTLCSGCGMICYSLNQSHVLYCSREQFVDCEAVQRYNNQKEMLASIVNNIFHLVFNFNLLTCDSTRTPSCTIRSLHPHFNNQFLVSQVTTYPSWNLFIFYLNYI